MNTTVHELRVAIRSTLDPAPSGSDDPDFIEHAIHVDEVPDEYELSDAFAERQVRLYERKLEHD